MSSGTCREGEYTTVSVGGVNYLLHILVAKTFLSAARGEQTQVDHKDGNQGNARTQNLEWVTPSENVRRRFARAVAPQRTVASPADAHTSVRDDHGQGAGPRRLNDGFASTRSVWL